MLRQSPRLLQHATAGSKAAVLVVSCLTPPTTARPCLALGTTVRLQGPSWGGRPSSPLGSGGWPWSSAQSAHSQQTPQEAEPEPSGPAVSLDGFPQLRWGPAMSLLSCLPDPAPASNNSRFEWLASCLQDEQRCPCCPSAACSGLPGSEQGRAASACRVAEARNWQSGSAERAGRTSAAWSHWRQQRRSREWRRCQGRCSCTSGIWPQ